MITTAKIIRAALPSNAKLFLVGISLGAIIAANVTAQGALNGVIDGSVCISGCFDTEVNSTYQVDGPRTHTPRHFTKLIVFNSVYLLALSVRLATSIKSSFERSHGCPRRCYATHRTEDWRQRYRRC